MFNSCTLRVFRKQSLSRIGTQLKATPVYHYPSMQPLNCKPHIQRVRKMSHQSFFASAPFIPADVIFALIAEYVQDASPQKVNLGQGTYRDENGKPWVLESVSQARQQSANEGLLHEYLPILGLPEFRKAAAEVALGSSLFQKKQKQLATCQSISGTGALHNAGLLLRRCNETLPKVYIPEPTWSNHIQVFSSLGFPCQQFRYYDSANRRLDIDSYTSTLKSAERGSIVILHACAHNPTGYDPTAEQWKAIGSIVKERGLFPLFDAAYLGFNSGNIGQDAFAIRYFIDDLELEAGVCMSFAKNMGLYGERVGCVIFVTNSETTAVNSQSLLESLQRSEVSNPPAYGAKIAAKILNDKKLKDVWYGDLTTMSSRIRSMRYALRDGLVAAGAPGNWDHLVAQRGMFGFLGLSKDVVLELKERFHVYMADNSRVSIAGLNESNVEHVAKSIARVLKEREENSAPQARL